MDYPIEVTLKRLVTVGDKTYDKLVFDEPDLNAQIAYAELEQTFSNPPTDVDGGKVIRFWISHLADVPMEVAGKIKGADLGSVEAALDTILGVSKAKGGASVGNETPAK